MVFIALGVRLLLVVFSLRYLLDPAEDYFGFGWEVGRVARALATGHGFSSPYQGDTGPTAVLPPLYPLLVGGIFKIFGVYTRASAIVLLVIQSLTSAVTCIPIYFIGQRTFGARVARLAGWAWVFFPYAIFISAATIWSTSLSALLVALIFWLALRIGKGAGWGDWLALGAAGGMAALVNPTILPICAALGAWIWYCQRPRQAQVLTGAAVAAAIVALCIAPWIIRNYRVFGRLIPMRSNLGLHLYVGNTIDTAEYWHAELDPAHSPQELAQMNRLGEIAYMTEKKRQAFDFIRQHPRVYAYLVFKRISYFWTGVWNLSPRFLQEDPGQAFNIPICTAISILMFGGLYRAFKAGLGIAWPFALCLLIYPLIFYLTTYEIPYRHPLDPLIAVLAVAGAIDSQQMRGVSHPSLQLDRV